MSTKKGKSRTRIVNEKDQPRKIVCDPDAPIASNEYDAMRGSQLASSVNWLDIIEAFKADRSNPTQVRCRPPIDYYKAKANGCAELMFWRKGEVLDDRLIVFIDRKARVAALGYPDCPHTLFIERMKGNRMLVHQHENPIIRPGMWSIAMMVAKVNGDDGWGMSGGTLTSVLQNIHHLSGAVEEKASRAVSGAGAA